MKFYGVGANSRKFDFPATEFLNGKWVNTKPYGIWNGMLKRCYKNGGMKNYEDVFVSEAWLDYQDFALWYDQQPYYRKSIGWHLDKDIINKEARVYSPETCSLIPIELNLVVRTMYEREENQGVSWHKRDLAYRAYLKAADGKVLQKCGFKTEQEAFSWYKVRREEQLKLFAEKYKDVVDVTVYKSLLLFTVQDKLGERL